MPETGAWEVSGAAGLAKGVDCGGVKNSAVTHVSPAAKPQVTLLWTPPRDFSGKVVFVATVVEEFKTYWVSKGPDSVGAATFVHLRSKLDY